MDFSRQRLGVDVLAKELHPAAEVRSDGIWIEGVHVMRNRRRPVGELERDLIAAKATGPKWYERKGVSNPDVDLQPTIR